MALVLAALGKTFLAKQKQSKEELKRSSLTVTNAKEHAVILDSNTEFYINYIKRIHPIIKVKKEISSPFDTKTIIINNLP